MARSMITEVGYCHGVKKIITCLIFSQSFQTISEFLAEIPVNKMRYWSLNLIILEDDGSDNNAKKTFFQPKIVSDLNSILTFKQDQS